MQKDWLTFYKNKQAPTESSGFAKYVVGSFVRGMTVVDLGAGNGRDTLYLANFFKKVEGYDPNAIEGMNVVQKRWQDVKSEIRDADVVYSRFFLHAIPPEEVLEILELCTGYFCAEARAYGDKPKLYPEHQRHFIRGDSFLQDVIQREFEVLEYVKGRGLAKYKGEDPLVVRLIARKKR